MIDSKRVLAIVTARGGSKGLPGKNTKPLGGKPLIAWTVEAARGAGCIDRVVVTSDSEEILSASREAGAETPFVRPPELATDTAKQEDAVFHAMDWIRRDEGRPHDIVVLLAPTNPLRPASEIAAVVTHLARQGLARSVLTVVECEHHPLRANVLPADRSMRDFMPEDLKLKNRQELPTYYRISGSVCAIDWEHFERHRSFLTPETFAWVTSARSGLDIDGPLDFALAEILLARPDLG